MTQASPSAIGFAELFILLQGRIGRKLLWQGYVFLLMLYLCGYLLMSLYSQNLNLAPLYWFIPFAWGFFALLVKRCHDLNHSAYWLLWLLLPALGPLFVFIQLFLRKGSDKPNQFGIRWHTIVHDYFQNPASLANQAPEVVNDVSESNPILVKQVVTPASVAEIATLLKSTAEPISIGGGRFSMGGQIASPDSIHIDMRSMNKVIQFSPQHKTILVQAGIRWCDIQKFIDPYGLSVKIMQTYANFTVGGSLSVNCHGRYMGLGPVVLSVNQITLVLADGQIVTASPSVNTELFYAAIGGYGGIGIIAEVELSLADNAGLLRHNQRLLTQDYLSYFKQNVATSQDILFHNADIYPPHYSRVNAVSWIKCSANPSVKLGLQKVRRVYAINRYFLWAISSTPFGKWRREFIIDAWLFWRKRGHWRNFEAGYDVSELAPIATKKAIWVLQEYFIPIAKFDEFSAAISEILQRYNVNALNISIRHALADPGTLLAWAKEESFAFVLYYKQGLTAEAKNKVAIWTRELIDAVIACGGAYYLPYQIHATAEQFHAAYPKAKQFFALKAKWDPHYRFRNQLWNTYYQPTLQAKG